MMAAASSDPATVSITITPPTPVDHPPIAVSQTVYVSQDATFPNPFYGYDPDGRAVTYSVVTPPTYGTVREVGGEWTYTPDPGFRGTDGAVFTASDGTLTSDAAVTTFKVGNPDGLSVGNEIFTVGRGLTLTANVLSNDTSPNGGVHLVSSTPASDGTATCDVGLGTCTYTADGTATSDKLHLHRGGRRGPDRGGKPASPIVDDNQPPVIVGADTATADEGSSFSYSYTGGERPGRDDRLHGVDHARRLQRREPAHLRRRGHVHHHPHGHRQPRRGDVEGHPCHRRQPAPSLSYGGPNGRVGARPVAQHERLRLGPRPAGRAHRDMGLR